MLLTRTQLDSGLQPFLAVCQNHKNTGGRVLTWEIPEEISFTDKVIGDGLGPGSTIGSSSPDDETSESDMDKCSVEVTYSEAESEYSMVVKC